MSTINTTNPQHIEYKTAYLEIVVLGGINLQSLDRLRVTLKITDKHKEYIPIRHTLDLYNDNLVEKLIRKIGDRLELGTSIAEKVLSDLIEELEQYRLQQIEQENTPEVQKVELTKEERKEAEDYLRAANLLERTKEDIGKSGVIGEENNRLLMYLIFTSRKRANPLHVISLAKSGMGKTHLQEKVSELIPEEDIKDMTSLSENALYYFGIHDLCHKLLIIEDLDGAEGVLYPLRELKSKGFISKTIVHKNTKGETRSVNLRVEGPVCVSAATTKEGLYEDNANRSFLIYLDESEAQDTKIMEYQRKLSAGKIDSYAEQQIREKFKNMQRILQPIRVINPYAELLQLPKSVFKPRRTNNHYLQFIELVTYYHQKQREEKADENGELFIETTLEDIAIANKLMKEILLRKSDELTGACRYYFEQLKYWLKEEKKTAFTNQQARVALKENHSNQKRYMLQLQQEGFIKKGTGDKKKGFYYEVVSMEEYEQLKAGIGNVLDNIFLKLSKEVQSSEEVHSSNEPSKVQEINDKSKKFKKTEQEISE